MEMLMNLNKYKKVMTVMEVFMVMLIMVMMIVIMTLIVILNIHLYKMPNSCWLTVIWLSKNCLKAIENYMYVRVTWVSL